MIIQVTAEDIKHGEVESCTTCPIALAILRQLNTLKGIIVFDLCVYIYHQYIELPLKAKEFIANYDNSKYKHLAVPFEFELNYVAAPSA